MKKILIIFLFFFSFLNFSFADGENIRDEKDLTGFRNILLTTNEDELNNDTEFNKNFLLNGFSDFLDFNIFYKTLNSDGTVILFDNNLNYCNLSTSTCFNNKGYKGKGFNSDKDSNIYSGVFETKDYVVFINGHHYSQYYITNSNFISIYSRKNNSFLNLIVNNVTLSTILNSNGSQKAYGHYLLFKSFESINGKNQIQLNYFTNNNDLFYFTIDFDLLEDTYFSNNNYFYNIIIEYGEEQNHYLDSSVNFSKKGRKYYLGYKYNVNIFPSASNSTLYLKSYKDSTNSQELYGFVEYEEIPGLKYNYKFSKESSEDLYANYYKNKNNIFYSGNYHSFFAYFLENYIIYVNYNKEMVVSYKDKGGNFLKTYLFGNEIFGRLFTDYTLLNFGYNKVKNLYYISYLQNGFFDGDGNIKTLYGEDIRNFKDYNLNEKIYYLGSIDGIDIVLKNDIKNLPNLYKAKFTQKQNSFLFIGKGSDGNNYFYYQGLNNKIYRSAPILSDYKLNGKPFGQNIGGYANFGDNENIAGGSDDIKFNKEEGNFIFNFFKKEFLSIFGNFFDTFKDILFTPFSLQDTNFNLKINFLDLKIKNGFPNFGLKEYGVQLPNKEDYVIKGINGLPNTDETSGVGKKLFSLLFGIMYILSRIFIFSFYVLPFILFYYIFKLFFYFTFGQKGIQGSDTIKGKVVGFIVFGIFISSLGGISYSLYNIFLPIFDIGQYYINNIFGYIVYNFFDYPFFVFFVNGFFTSLSVCLLIAISYSFFKNN